jgi:DNA primase
VVRSPHFFISDFFSIFFTMITKEVDFSQIVDILEEFLGDYHSHNESSGQISFDCPVCSYEIKGLDRGDGKGNLEINYIKNVYKCWSCGDMYNTHGSLYSLIKKHGNPRLLKRYQILKPDDEYQQGAKFYKKVQLPKEFIPLTNIHPAYKLTPHYKQVKAYLNKRNITEDIIRKFNIGYCNDGEYFGRVIIPSYDIDDELNYFIARSYLTKSKLKYKNPEAQKEIIIFNENIINWDETIYLVEGVFDSIFLPNSIPMLGKHLSKSLFDRLYSSAKKIVIVLDGDAWDDAQKLYHQLNCGKLMGKIWISKLPKDKDIADLQGDLTNYKPKQID